MKYLSNDLIVYGRFNTSAMKGMPKRSGTFMGFADFCSACLLGKSHLDCIWLNCTAFTELQLLEKKKKKNKKVHCVIYVM